MVFECRGRSVQLQVTSSSGFIVYRPCEVRYPKGKSTLKEKLKVEVSTRKHDADDVILDGSAVLYHLHWPKDARINDFVDVFIEYVKKYFEASSMYLTFDRYRDYSIKEQTRLEGLSSIQGHAH